MPTGELNIKNCRVKRHRFKDTDLRYLYGIIMMAKGNTIEFYVDSIEVRENWM